MDPRSRAAFDQSVDLAMARAEQALCDRQGRLDEALRAAASAQARLAAATAERVAWVVGMRESPAEPIAASVVVDRLRHGDALAERERGARAAVRRAEVTVGVRQAEVDESRRSAADQLARRRWIATDERRARADDARTAEVREDEE